jgi:hypothetical protein
MILMVEFTFPAFKANQTAQAWVDVLKASPIPEYVKLIEIYNYSGGEGIKGNTYYELEKGKEDEAVMWVVQTLLAMGQAVEGYKYTTDIVLPIGDAYKAVGMESPT